MAGRRWVTVSSMVPAYTQMHLEQAPQSWLRSLLLADADVPCRRFGAEVCCDVGFVSGLPIAKCSASAILWGELGIGHLLHVRSCLSFRTGIYRK